MQLEYTFDDNTFVYDIDAEKLRQALANIVYRHYFKECGIYNKEAKNICKGIRDFIYYFDLEETLFEAFDDEVKEFYKEDAYSEYRFQ